jgi:hypothetical protein
MSSLTSRQRASEHDLKPHANPGHAGCSLPRGDPRWKRALRAIRQRGISHPCTAFDRWRSTDRIILGLRAAPGVREFVCQNARRKSRCELD